jgi:CubicO group peptidase (beta-lactamase class C family)
MPTHPVRPKSSGNEAPNKSPFAHVTFSRERLDRMHTALRKHVESGLLPGLVTLVDHRGRKQVEAIGTMAFDSDAPMRRDTIFRLASMTKPVTAVGAMILVEECKFRLEDPVDEWLPELKDRKVLRRIDSALDDWSPRSARSRCTICSLFDQATAK